MAALVGDIRCMVLMSRAEEREVDMGSKQRASHVVVGSPFLVVLVTEVAGGRAGRQHDRGEVEGKWENVQSHNVAVEARRNSMKARPALSAI